MAGFNISDNLIVKNGSIGVGVSDPSYSVDVANSLATTVGVVKNATGDNIKLQAGGTGYSDFNITTESGGEKLLTIKDTSDVQFFGSDQSTVKMTWDASADSLGIGVTSPTQKLDVNGTVKATAFVGDGSGLTGISGGGGSTGPAFFAKKHIGGSGPPQYITPNTYTKVTFTVEDIDTDSDFTNSRFTPGTAGYYWIHVNLLCACGAGALNTAIYKNGSSQIISVYTEEQNYSAKGTVSGLVYLNGSTDYVEAYVLMSAAPGTSSNASVQLNQSSYFTGFLAR